MPDPVVIIGGGLAGLTCAKTIATAGVDFLLLEASDDIGGRVRTDEMDGFLLDRGFQVLLTAYPEAQQSLDYDALQLRAFEPGSLIQTTVGRKRMSDPWRQPGRAFETAFFSVGSFADKLRIARLRWSANLGDVNDLFQRVDQSAIDELESRGFSKPMIEQFLRPFLSGVFLDTELATSARMLHFVFRMFSHGDTALPNAGMGEIPMQLARDLPADAIRTNSVVQSIDKNRVTLLDGERISFRNVVIATEQPAAARLMPELATSRTPRSVHCVYFSAPATPLSDRMLLLNGTGRGLVNNLCVPSDVAPGYAPDGRSLISASVLQKVNDVDALPNQILAELQDWFGDDVKEWQHLRTYSIPYALPNQTTPAFEPAVQPLTLRDNVFVCGDYRTNGSINGAMQSGRLVAESIARQS